MVYEAEEPCGSLSGNSENSIACESDGKWNSSSVKIGRPICAGCVDLTMCLGGVPLGRIGRQKYYLYRRYAVAFFWRHGANERKVLSACRRARRGVAFSGALSEPMNQKYYARRGI